MHECYRRQLRLSVIVNVSGPFSFHHARRRQDVPHSSAPFHNGDRKTQFRLISQATPLGAFFLDSVEKLEK
jgi:hypothetical protein